jgi:hypothetical protein
VDHDPDAPRVVLEALQYAAFGFKIVPLHRRSKTPILERFAGFEEQVRT